MSHCAVINHQKYHEQQLVAGVAFQYSAPSTDNALHHGLSFLEAFTLSIRTLLERPHKTADGSQDTDYRPSFLPIDNSNCRKSDSRKTEKEA